MFGWLKRRVQIAVVNSRDQDIDRFIRGLKGASSAEVGAIVACAAHWRNLLEAQFGWDLDHPDFVAAQDAGAALTLNRMIREIQKDRPALAAGLMVWLHSIRASETPEIRIRGREMWAELGRGIPHADEGAGSFLLFGVSLDIDGVERVPENLTPTGANTGHQAVGGDDWVAVMAREIHEMCCVAHHSRDTLGTPLHRHFSRYSTAVLKGHRVPAPGDRDQVHIFQLSDGQHGFRVMVFDGDQDDKAWVSVAPDGDFDGVQVQSGRKGRYMVWVERPLARPQGRLATKLADAFVTTYDAMDMGDPSRSMRGSA